MFMYLIFFIVIAFGYIYMLTNFFFFNLALKILYGCWNICYSEFTLRFFSFVKILWSFLFLKIKYPLICFISGICLG